MEDTRKRKLINFAGRIRTIAGWYVSLVVGSLVLALLDLERFQDLPDVLMKQRHGLGAIMGVVLASVFMWVVKKTAQWCDRSGRNWEWWIIVAGHVAGACTAPLMYLLGMSLHFGKGEAGVVYVMLTFLLATLACLAYTLTRYYLEGKNFFFKNLEE